VPCNDGNHVLVFHGGIVVPGGFKVFLYKQRVAREVWQRWDWFPWWFPLLLFHSSWFFGSQQGNGCITNHPAVVAVVVSDRGTLDVVSTAVHAAKRNETHCRMQYVPMMLPHLLLTLLCRAAGYSIGKSSEPPGSFFFMIRFHSKVRNERMGAHSM
jgi:hypothetical protein